MPDYRSMYKVLFQSQTKAIRLHEEAIELLKKAQQETEEMYISASDEDDEAGEDETEDKK